MPVLFISRGSMSGVYQVVKCLEEETGIRCISHESLVTRIDRHGEIASRVVRELDKAVPNYDRFSTLRWSYLVLLRQALLEEIVEGNAVYHGYSAHFLLPTLQHFVRVRIDAPLELRVKMTMERLQCNENEARSYITAADEERVNWARLMYCRDIRDPRFYDLHLNLGHMSLKAVCGFLERALAEDEFQMIPETGMQVEKLLFEATVEAALVSDPRTCEYEISAKLEGSRIDLFGPYLDKEKMTPVIEIASGVSGVDDVSYNPGYAPAMDTLDMIS